MIEKMIFHLMSEQKNEDDHKNWCDLELEKTNTSIDDKQSKSAELNAKIEEETAAVQKLADEIKEANEMVASIVAHMKEASEIRTIGRKENAQAIDDAEKAQTAIASAVAVLQDFYKDSGAIKKEAWEFFQHKGGDPTELPESPATWDSGYTSVSDPTSQPNGIITTLEAVSSDFATMEADTRAQEAADQKAFEEQMKQSKIEQTRRESEVREKTAESKRRSERIASLTKAKKHTDTEIYKTVQYMKDLQPACVEGDSTYDERKAARSQEVEALQEAQQILANAYKEKSTDASSFLRAHVKRHH